MKKMRIAARDKGIDHVINDLANPLGLFRRLMLYPTELRARTTGGVYPPAAMKGGCA